MRPEIDRLKQDLETMHKALGLAPAMGRDWVQWLKRDQWFSLWWCVPGIILIASTLLPPDSTRHGGLMSAQWAGLLVAASMLVITAMQMRRATARDGRPEGLIRETKRSQGLTAEGWWFGVALAVQAFLYIAWSRHYRIGLEPFWAGWFMIMGSTFLIAAMAARAWLLLGWAIPLLAYGLCVPAVGMHSRLNGILFGLMFMAVALSFSLISTLQLRRVERQK